MQSSGECARCAEWRARGARFCGNCGRPLDTSGCPMCQICRERGDAYCRSCGRSLADMPPGTDGTGKKKILEDVFNPVAAACTVLFIILCIAAFIVVLSRSAGILDELGGKSLGVYIPLGLSDIVLFRMRGTLLCAYFVFEVIVIGVCILLTLRRSLTADSVRSGNLAHSDMGVCATLLATSLGISMIYFFIMGSGGHSVDASWMNEYSDNILTFLLTNAGFQEEIAYRVIPVGIPVAAVALLAGRGARSWKLLLGGFGMSKTAFVFIILSAVLFGLAHYEGWGWVKIIQTFAAGLIFAYAYVQYGLHVSILIHFVNDTASLVPVLGVIADMILMFAGVFFLVYWILNRNRAVYDVREMPAFPEIPGEKSEK